MFESILVYQKKAQTGTLISDSLTYNISNNKNPFQTEIEDIPYRKWINILITTHRRVLEIYLDGKLYKTKIMPWFPKISNNYNIYLGENDGIDGAISRLEYYPNYTSASMAKYIYDKGRTNYLGFLSNNEILFELNRNSKNIASYSL